MAHPTSKSTRGRHCGITITFINHHRLTRMYTGPGYRAETGGSSCARVPTRIPRPFGTQHNCYPEFYQSTPPNTCLVADKRSRLGKSSVEHPSKLVFVDTRLSLPTKRSRQRKKKWLRAGASLSRPQVEVRIVNQVRPMIFLPRHEWCEKTAHAVAVERNKQQPPPPHDAQNLSTVIKSRLRETRHNNENPL